MRGEQLSDGDEPETVLMIGYHDAEVFRPLTMGDGGGLRELVVFTERTKAGLALEGLHHNPEMVRLAVPMHRLHAREISLAGAMEMARAVGCSHVSIDVNFENPHRRIPVSEASG